MAIQKAPGRRLLILTLLTLTAGFNATAVSCVDSRVYGVSSGLLLQEGPSDSSLSPGSEARVVLQAVDDDEVGVPDQKVELVVTDTSRLWIVGAEGEKRRVMSTGRKLLSRGVVIDGGLEVVLVVPKDAKPGRVSLIASLEGQKGAQSKTQFIPFDIVEGGGEGGAGGMGGAGGAGGTAGAGGGAGFGGEGAVAGEGGMPSGGAAEGGALGVAGMESVSGGVGGNAQ